MTIHKKSKKISIWVKLIALFVGLTLAGASFLVILISMTYPKLPSMDELRNYQPKLPLQVYSADNVILGQFGQEHRVFVSFKDTPQMLIKAILAAEDERFYQHGGIDYIGVMRALISNIISGHIQSGASTITMQVARNFFLSSQRTYRRKFNEILLSYKIEKSLTKDQILELYINQIFLGQRSYGFGEAAITYFGKPLNQLSIAQYAVLAGLPKAPSAYNPVVNRNRSHERELYVLERMKTLNFITEQQYEEAKNQKINVIEGTVSDATDSGGYIAEMVRQMMYDKFGEKIYQSGFRVYTTVNSKMEQDAYIALRNGLLQYDHTHSYGGAEDHVDLDDDLMSYFSDYPDYGDLQVAIVINASPNRVEARIRNGNTLTFTGDDLNYIRKRIGSSDKKSISRGAVIRVRNVDGKWIISQTPKVQGAIVAIDPNNGAIKALVGGFDFTQNKFNHVTQAMRQPGSGFKPFIYSSALEKGFTPDSIIDDSEICFPSGGNNGEQWCPRNDEDDFNGKVTFREALSRSLNIVTVKILNEITPQYAISYLPRFGFSKDQFQPFLTMALGANEVTPLQMAVGYSVFANGGYQVNPYLIDSIRDNKNNIIAQTQPDDIHKEQPVIDPRNAYIMNSIMQDVVRYGTGARAYRELKRNDMAGKTGTTTDSKDVWFNGYTPNIVTITWIGYDQPQTLGAHAYGATIALPVWIEFMKNTLPQIPETQINMPPGIKVEHNVTWKGNDEYVYDTSFKPQNIESNPNFKTDITNNSPESSSENNDNQAEDNTTIDNNNSDEESLDKGNDKIGDLIKNIKD